MPVGTRASAPFRSLLFGGHGRPPEVDRHREPPFFGDLNLDQVVDSMTKGRAEYDLVPFFCTPVTDVETVGYRQAVFRDLERARLRAVVDTFARTMQQMRAHLGVAAKVYYPLERQRWFLNAVDRYCQAVTGLLSDLAGADLTSEGLLALRGYLGDYTTSQRFAALREETRRLLSDLSTLRYCLHVKGNRITVGHYDGEVDFSGEVLRTFERFQQGVVKDYRVTFSATADMDHVEAGILTLVAKLHPDLFAALDRYCTGNLEYLDPVVGGFDRELQFYLAYLDYLAPLRATGLTVCYPRASSDCKDVEAHETFDLALAAKLISDKRTVVCNDFQLRDPERVLVVSGPNQGGKTTLARTFGQLHYLASLGCPVPGRDARLFLPDRIFTHFEREEDLATLAGKLEDDLRRIRAILTAATPDSIIILNEIFTSTTLRDALFLSKEILGQITALGALGVCVTFLDELSTLNDRTVSMVSTVVAEDPAVRTYKLVRKAADGRAYALAIADRYHLTYDAIIERLGP